VHPDVRTGTMISADYPAVVCNTLEGALPGTHCFYMNGTAGDLNHIDVNCPEWDKNSGPEHVLHMGRTIAGKILSMYTKARPVATGPVRTAVREITVPLKLIDAKKLEQAREIMRLYESGETDKIESGGMGLTTAVFEARRTIARANSGDTKMLLVTSVAMGDFCITGVPGEGFCDIGRQIRAASPFAVQFTSGITNGHEGYFPMADAFGVNGYESRTSPYMAGVGEALAEAGKALTKELFEN